MIEPTINGLWFSSRPIRLDAIIRAWEAHIWPNYRFHSCMEDGQWIARHKQMDRNYHFLEVNVANEDAIDAYVQNVMAESLDKSYPAWRVIILRAPAPSRSAMLFRLHHSISDGLGLLFAFSPLLGCEGGVDALSKIPLPKIMLPESVRNQAPESPIHSASSKSPGGCRKFCNDVCSIFGFCRGASVVLTARQDTETVLSPPIATRSPFLPFNGKRVYTRLPPIPMSQVKAACKRNACTVNDILMAALSGALRRYGGDVRGDKRLKESGHSLDFKSMVMIALPREIDEEDMTSALCNNVLFASCPLPVDQPTLAGRLRCTIENFGNLKSKAYMGGLMCLTNCLKGVLPTNLLRKAASETFSKHSLLVTNVPGPTVPVTFPKEGGEVMGEVHMVFPNVIPQVSFISYNGFVYSNLVADPALYPEPKRFGELLLAEVQALTESNAFEESFSSTEAS